MIFYGQPRFVLQCWHSIQNHIIDCNDTEIYIHTWIPNTLPDKRYQIADNHVGDSNFIESIFKCYKPQAIKIEQQKTFPDLVPPEHKHYSYNFILQSMMYSIREGWYLIDRSLHHYDCICFIRFDQIVWQPIIFTNESDTIHCQENHCNRFKDHLVYGDPRVMAWYANTLGFMCRLPKDNFTPEEVFESNLNDYGAKIQKHVWNNSIYRGQ